MAKAEAIWEGEPKLAGVTLTLNENEARFLSRIMWRIGGDPYNTARKHASSIMQELEREGFSGDGDKNPFKLDGYINCPFIGSDTEILW